MSLAVQVAGKSDLGCIRTNNEDNFGYDTRCGIFVVCDGMGGAASGEVASKLGVDTVLNYFRQHAKNGLFPSFGKQFEGVSQRANALASAVQLANAEIFESAGKNKEHAGMGSTVVAVAVKGNFFSIVNVGDSRIYLVRGGEIRQLTNDHSLVMEQVRRGLITMEEAESSTIQNIIIRALGSEETVEPDVDDLMAMPGDVLMLASDGLTKHVKDPKILQIVQSAPTLDKACDDLISAAKDDGGDDNITCVLLRLVQQSWWRSIFPGGAHKWQNSL
jgi:serine/threonine protein phosphatase PrpC